MKNTMKPILDGLVLYLSSSLSCATDLEAMKATGIPLTNPAVKAPMRRLQFNTFIHGLGFQ